MLPRFSQARNTAKLHVTVTDLPGIQRVLTMLTGRQYMLTRFDAEEEGAGRWRASLDLIADPEQVELLEARLHRVPSVLAVDVTLGGALAATA
jgi:acetolactate synthase regulatory subunit